MQHLNLIHVLFLVAELSIEYPSSPQIVQKTNEIISSTNTNPTCSIEEKNSLKNLKEKLDEGLVIIEDSLSEATTTLTGIQL